MRVAVLLLVLLLRVSRGRPLPGSSGLTYDRCLPTTTCARGRRCVTDLFRACSPTDAFCYCRLPGDDVACLSAGDCAGGEVCHQSVDGFGTFCASPSASLNFLSFARAPAAFPSSGGLFAECSTGRGCGAGLGCRLADDLSAPCASGRRCVCMTDVPRVCLRRAHCAAGEVCAGNPVFFAAVCVRADVVRARLALSEVGEQRFAGRTLDPCARDAECLGRRVCRRFGAAWRTQMCAQGTPCVCVQKEGPRQCRMTADCPERGEVCARVRDFGIAGSVCVSAQTERTYAYVQRTNAVDVCPTLIDVDRPRDTPRTPAVRDARVRTSARIVGGRPAVARLRQGMAVVETGDRACSAVVVGERWVLTAAHCRVTRGAKVYVGLARDAPFADRPFVRVKRAVMHPRYCGPVNEEFDVMALELVKPVQASGFRLNRKSELLRKERAVRAVGYGQVVQNRFDGRLRQVDLKIVATERCRLLLNKASARRNRVNVQEFVCAAVVREQCGICSGDSGGPLLVYEDNMPVVVGITSNSVQCSTTEFPALFARVDTVLPWLRQVGVQFDTN